METPTRVGFTECLEQILAISDCTAGWNNPGSSAVFTAGRISSEFARIFTATVDNLKRQESISLLHLTHYVYS